MTHTTKNNSDPATRETPQATRFDQRERRQEAKVFSCAEVFGGNAAADLLVRLPGISGHLRSIPCQSRVGGDIHYISTCGSGLISRFAIADVVGHGSEVSAVSHHTHSLLRQFMNAIDHRRALRALNGRLTARGLDALTTAAVFTFFPPTQTLSFSYAGHPPAWYFSQKLDRWIRLTLQATLIDESLAGVNYPLAVNDGVEFSIERIQVEAGDMLLVLSDGFTDALNDERQVFGAARVDSRLASHRSANPVEVTGALLDELADFCGTRRFQHDDVTVLALRFEPISKLECARYVLHNRIVKPVLKFMRPVYDSLSAMTMRSSGR